MKIRVEVLKLRTKPGVAKMIGIIICIGGAACLAFYKGPHFKLFWHFHPLGHHQNVQHSHHLPTTKTWVKGCFLMLLSNFFWALWLVLQAQVLKSYPSKLLFTALQCLLSSIQSFAIAIVLERRPSEWQLGWNVRLLAVAYGGIVVTGVTYYLQAWVIEKKGPVFLAMWTPLALIITMFSSAILLGEVITLGSILGGILLILGLYSVLWGKTREQKKINVENSFPAPTEKGVRFRDPVVVEVMSFKTGISVDVKFQDKCQGWVSGPRSSFGTVVNGVMFQDRGRIWFMDMGLG
ncbi:hypothetical protein TIFTF001_004103 [Ficus carica]|uniref:WAT1-related protein n=1 Tax=Ficus carica TaxID=3494 RepID=A0AA87ZU79_FICCA|nr:hypothetical protein TIFTF001_004103 [Ficus carica]